MKILEVGVEVEPAHSHQIPPQHAIWPTFVNQAILV